MTLDPDDIATVTSMVEGWSVYTGLSLETKAEHVAAWTRTLAEIAPDAPAPFA